MKKDILKDIELFLFDMDGTLYLGNRLFPFTKRLLSEIKSAGKRYIFMTNNSSKSVADYVGKLEKMGINTSEDDFLTSSQATALHLKTAYPGKRLYVCGTESLKTELRKENFTVTEELDEVEVVVMGFDTELTFKKLEDVCRLLLSRDLPYIATNPDYVCHTEFGSVPDCGSVCDMIFNATGKRPVVIGKPQAAMPRLAMERCNVSSKKTAVIGDRIYTDVISGINAGAVSVLVLSGETTEEILSASDVEPDLVLQSAEELLQYI